jgi:2-polyprenyl-3-methyl-5-hydroxy-6-metoxy-1,4-benzoquinol methylase
VRLGLRDESFDVVVAIAVIEHVADAKEMIEECHRVLKVQGMLILTTPDPFFESAERFMTSPAEFPCELPVERAMKTLGVRLLLLNQMGMWWLGQKDNG